MSELDISIGAQQRLGLDRVSPIGPCPDEIAAGAKTEHEDRDDERRGMDGVAEDVAEDTDPDDLVDQPADSRAEEEEIQQAGHLALSYLSGKVEEVEKWKSERPGVVRGRVGALWRDDVPRVARQAASQTPRPYTPPRTAFGQPDLQGIWQVVNTAAWDIQDHAGQRFPGLPARFSVPAGQGVVEGNEIPYQPWALRAEAGELSRPG